MVAVEGALLAGSFDAAPLASRANGWWIRLVAHAGLIMPLGISVAAATALIAGPRLLPALARSPAPSSSALRARLLAHLVAFAVLYWMTAYVFERAHTSALSVAAWAACAAAAAATACTLLTSVSSLVRLVRRHAGWLAASAAVGTLAWAAGRMTSEWWHPLGRATLWSVHAIVALFSTETVLRPADFIVGTRDFQVEIAAGCSGYEGIGLAWVFLATYLWLFRDRLRFPNALLLIPLATLVMFAVNSLRLAMLIGIGHAISPQIAVGGFHANSGSLLLCLVALGLAWGAPHTALFGRESTSALGIESASEAGIEDNPTAVYLGPLVAVFAAAMATGLLTTQSQPGFDALYGVRVLAGAAVLWAFRREYRAWVSGWRWSWAAVGVGVIVFVVWLALEPAAAAAARDTGDVLANMSVGWSAAWILLRVCGAVVIVPIAEELAFRGYLARRLVARDFEAVSLQRLTPSALVVSSVLFGAMHDRLIAGTIAGVAYGLIAARRGQLGDAVVAHATTNAMLAAWVLATGAWSLW